MIKWKNERGSVAFYTIGLLAVTGVLLFFLVNMIKIYATGQQASTSAEQAAIAATNVMFEEVYDAVTDHTYIHNLEERKEDLEDEMDSEEELTDDRIEEIEEEIEAIDDVLDFSEDVEEEKGDFLGGGEYKNQAAMAAIDQVLSEKLQKDLPSLHHSIYSSLKTRVQQHLNMASGNISSSAEQVVIDNGGESSETVVYMFNDENRIEVKTAAKYEETNENIEQKAVGPSVQFIDYISWVNGPIYIN
mgnify:CR=1 FL=1